LHDVFALLKIRRRTELLRKVLRIEDDFRVH